MNVLRSPENGTFFLHLARSLGKSMSTSFSIERLWFASWFVSSSTLKFVLSREKRVWCAPSWGQTTGFTVLSWVWIVFPRAKTIRSHKSRAGIPSNLNPASKEMISDSVELCETDVCFLHFQLIGTNVWLPRTHNVPPEVDFESSRSPAKSESWNSPSLHCLAVLLTWQYCL